MAENTYKWCDQQGINLQNIQALFKFEEIPNSRTWVANCSISDFNMLLTVIHSKPASYYDFMLVQTCLSHTHIHTHTDTHTRNKNFMKQCYYWTVLQYFLLYMFYFSSYKNKMMVTSPKLISWSTDCTCSFQTWLLIVIPLDWASLVHVSITLGASLMFQVLTAEPIFQ